MIGTGCGMRSPGDLTFAADIKLDFITDSTDSMKDSSGFFAHVYSEGRVCCKCKLLLNFDY